MEKSEAHSSEELFVQLFALNERHIRAFARSMGLDWTSVDDVVQTVSLVMWRKWDQFDPDTEFMRWARVITRFEVLKFRRTMARDRHIFQGDLMDLLADASQEREARVSSEQYIECLHACLNDLPERSRELIRAAYEGDKSIKEVAVDVGKSATALYKALDRIRNKLQACIETRLAAS
ncbi:MAG: RNA polymerase subunit sigma-70 [Verrucomicrobiales bacterium]|jgi:RNA polymerase sigma-70 factor (ECF subfamily)|nr:RNA polymerase subunit sigma-70 [Verrucomicrobiales bacterium]|tara:strand:- start:6394 stop:6927 length:534 start_codon:yes stop_codon:yes gene_type:complete